MVETYGYAISSEYGRFSDSISARMVSRNRKGLSRLLRHIEEQAREIERLRADLALWEELRLAIAEMVGADLESWPTHGNAPLAIAAGYSLRHTEAQEAAQEVERLRGLLREALPWLRDVWAICPPGTPEYLALGKLVEATIEAALQEGPANDDGAG